MQAPSSASSIYNPRKVGLPSPVRAQSLGLMKPRSCGIYARPYALIHRRPATPFRAFFRFMNCPKMTFERPRKSHMAYGSLERFEEPQAALLHRVVHTCGEPAAAGFPRSRFGSRFERKTSPRLLVRPLDLGGRLVLAPGRPDCGARCRETAGSRSQRGRGLARKCGACQEFGPLIYSPGYVPVRPSAFRLEEGRRLHPQRPRLQRAAPGREALRRRARDRRQHHRPPARHAVLSRRRTSASGAITRFSRWSTAPSSSAAGATASTSTFVPAA